MFIQNREITINFTQRDICRLFRTGGMQLKSVKVTDVRNVAEILYKSQYKIEFRFKFNGSSEDI